MDIERDRTATGFRNEKKKGCLAVQIQSVKKMNTEARLGSISKNVLT